MHNLNFITECKFNEALKHVTSSIDDALEYENDLNEKIEGNDIFNSPLFSNAVDPFSMIFGMGLSSGDEWLGTEVRRQLYKSYEQKIGEFHQIVLGSVDGWTDLKVGDKDKVDLRKDDKSIYIELKNKFNTCNHDSLASVRNKLLQVLDKNKDATAYWAYIVPNTVKKEGDVQWLGKGRTIIHTRLRKAWGSEVYKIVTGDGGNLYSMYKEIEKRSPYDKKDTLSKIADRIILSLKPHIDDIKEEVFYRTVADKK